MTRSMCRWCRNHHCDVTRYLWDARTKTHGIVRPAKCEPDLTLIGRVVRWWAR